MQRIRRRGVLSALATGLCVLMLATSWSTSAQAQVAVTLSEIRIDQPGADNDEYVEFAGAPDTSLDGLTYLVIGDGTGGSGVVEAVIDLSGQVIPASGSFVAAEASFTLGTADLTTDLNHENDDNLTVFLVEGFTGAGGDDLDTNDDGTLDVTPWSAILDEVALVKSPNPPSGTERAYSSTTVGPDGSFVPGHAHRCADGWTVAAFDPADGDDTPGAENDCEPDGGGGGEIGACTDPATLISTIQGTASASPEVGNTHDVQGIVVGDFQAEDELEGFFLQEEGADSDGDPLTSEGIFVFDNGLGVDVNIGDVVRVRGEVAEYFDLTELTSISGVVICDTGASASPMPLSLPVGSPDDFEPAEGMLVTFDQTLYVTENYNTGRFGEVDLASDGRLFTPTHLAEPGAPALALEAENDRRRILLDDGSNEENPVPPPPYFGADGTIRAGDTTDVVTGVLSYGFSRYRIHPTEEVGFTRVNERPEDPEVSGTLHIASFNVLNYFTTIDEGDFICGPSGSLECRGADSAAEFELQRSKILDALAAIDADVVGLLEIENNDSAAVADLVAGLNDILGAGAYAYVDTGTIGTDAIEVAFIYKPGTVALVGDYAILDSSVDPEFLDDKNRPVLAQTFEELATGAQLTVAVAHLKSKGSACDDVGDPDLGDGQGNCNATRTAAAEAMAEWLAGHPTGTEDDDVLVIGDLNSYAMEDPIDALKAGGYTDLLHLFHDADTYSYVFEGEAGYLDHALANASLLDQVVGAIDWHINADEPSALDYNSYNQPSLQTTERWRSSDHDPAIVGLELGGVSEPVPTCVICVLDEDATDAVHVDGNARITAAGDIAVNSSASPAVNASGNARITGTAIGIVGDTQRSGNARLSPAPTQVDPAGDPLASLVAPDLGEAAAPVVMAGGNSRRTIGPGTYRSIIVGGNARLTLEPGVYVITEGITVSGNGRLLGDGVVLYLACGGATSEMCAAGESGADLALSGNGRYELTAPTSGDYDGVAVFADRNNAAELSFRSNQGPSFTGTLYARSAHLSVEGNSRLTVEGARLVVATIDASGNARITVE